MKFRDTPFRRNVSAPRSLVATLCIFVTSCAMQGQLERVSDGVRIPLEIRFEDGDEGEVMATLPDGERIHGAYFGIEEIERRNLPLVTPWGALADEGPAPREAPGRDAGDALLVLTARGERGTELRCVARPEGTGRALGRCLDSRDRAYVLDFQRAPVTLPGSGGTLGPTEGLDGLSPVP